MTASRPIEVHFTPPPSEVLAGSTCVVIDTLRATTVITTLVAGGARAVYPVATLEAARDLAAALGAKLVGERGGLPAEGFDYGNSAAEFASLDVGGWTLVQSTSNGSHALEASGEAARTLVGCLRNRAAVAEALAEALAEPTARVEEGRVNIVCSGDGGGTRPSVEDTYTAGALVGRLEELDAEWELAAGARMAKRIRASYGSAAAAFDDAPHADSLRTLGLSADLEFAAAIDVDDVVPEVERDEAGRLVIRGDRRAR